MAKSSKATKRRGKPPDTTPDVVAEAEATADAEVGPGQGPEATAEVALGGESERSGSDHEKPAVATGETAGESADDALTSDGEMPELDLPEQATSTSVRLPTQIIPAVVMHSPPWEEETAMVRPYMLTGGRTKAKYSLELETLVSANKGVLTEELPDRIEHRSIVEACPEPRSVAEIASNLRMPLGVARVLVSDAADAGLITVHKTISGSDGAEAHLLLMERVLSGLRRL